MKKTDYILKFMSKLIDDQSLLSQLRTKMCVVNLDIEDARDRGDFENLQYYYGYRDALEVLYEEIINNRKSQRPHVSVEV